MDGQDGGDGVQIEEALAPKPETRPRIPFLKEALRPAEAPSGLGKRLRDRFAGLATEEFVVPKRHAPRIALQWDEPA